MLYTAVQFFECFVWFFEKYINQSQTLIYPYKARWAVVFDLSGTKRPCFISINLYPTNRLPTARNAKAISCIPHVRRTHVDFQSQTLSNLAPRICDCMFYHTTPINNLYGRAIQIIFARSYKSPKDFCQSHASYIMKVNFHYVSALAWQTLSCLCDARS